MSERAAPMFCPYCGEDRLRPWGDDPDAGHGDWSCEDCLRVFRLRYTGSTGRPASTGTGTAGTSQELSPGGAGGTGTGPSPSGTEGTGTGPSPSGAEAGPAPTPE